MEPSKPMVTGPPREVVPRILVVDDEEMVRELLRRFLVRKGYDVVLASNGRQAIQQFNDEHFNLVLSDVRMPEVDGMQLLRALKKTKPHVPVVLISGYGDVETVVSALKAGAENFLAKPLQMRELEKVIQQAVGLFCTPGEPARHFKGMLQTTRIRVDSEPDLICHLVSHVAMSAVSVGFARTDLDNNVKLALVEAITNAMEHGNHWVRDKQVEVESRVTPEELEVIITDQGPGFDYARLNDPTDPDNILSERGRGIFLMRAIMTHVRFQGRGNQVVLTKVRE